MLLHHDLFFVLSAFFAIFTPDYVALQDFPKAGRYAVGRDVARRRGQQ